MLEALALSIALWSVSAWAAPSLGATLGSISAADWFALVALSGSAGAMSLLYRVRRNLEIVALATATGESIDPNARQLIDWRLFAVCHMAGAMFVGSLMFLLAEAASPNRYIEAAAIALASWSGAKLADRLADAFSENIFNKLSAVLGRPNGK